MSLELPELALLRAAHSCTIISEMKNNMNGEAAGAPLGRRTLFVPTARAPVGLQYGDTGCSIHAGPNASTATHSRCPASAVQSHATHARTTSLPSAAAALQHGPTRRSMNAETRASLAMAGGGLEASHYVQAQKICMRVDAHFRWAR